MNVWVELIGTDGASERRAVATATREVDRIGIEDFGLSLDEGKYIQRDLQAELGQFQVNQAVQADRKCRQYGRSGRFMITDLAPSIPSLAFAACVCHVSVLVDARRAPVE